MRNKVETEFSINEDSTRLALLTLNDAENIDNLLSALKEDKVILIQNATQQNADNIIFDLAKKVGLAEKLETEAGFASFFGHRENIGKYFMTVNKRLEYQFIPPHSEGTHKTNMQLAAFYAIENTTDGGETILFNTDENSLEWNSLREVVVKLDVGNRKLLPQEIMQIKTMLNLKIPEDILLDQDVVISEKSVLARGIKLVDVLRPLEKIHSIILDRECYVYWDSVASFDLDSGLGYFNFLKSSNLLKEPELNLDISNLDNSHSRRVWSSGVDYNSLFKSKITRKLMAGDLVIMNNLTWAHSTNNWTPLSGQRKVVAAFA